MQATASLNDTAPAGARRATPLAASAHPLRAVAVALLCVLLNGCVAPRLGFLNAQGPVASGERHLFWMVVIVMLVVIAPVLVLTPLFAWHYRLSNRHNAFRPQWNFSWTLEFFIWVPPTLIVIGLAILLWHKARQFDPYSPPSSGVAPLEVQAVAFDWKWLFIYPESGVASVNQLAIPAGRPVHLSLTSETVMQSMFVPQLAGQIYAMAGMRTQLYLEADRMGSFVGENTQFNGTGFAQERFQVVSLRPDDFARWIRNLRTEGSALDDAALAALAVKAIAPRPIFFSSAPPGLFERLRAQARAGAGVIGKTRESR